MVQKNIRKQIQYRVWNKGHFLGVLIIVMIPYGMKLLKYIWHGILPLQRHTRLQVMSPGTLAGFPLITYQQVMSPARHGLGFLSYIFAFCLLLLTDPTGELFSYHPPPSVSQKVMCPADLGWASSHSLPPSGYEPSNLGWVLLCYEPGNLGRIDYSVPQTITVSQSPQ